MNLRQIILPIVFGALAVSAQGFIGIVAGPVSDLTANAQRNLNLADAVNLDNIVSLAWVAAEEAQKQQQEAMEKALGERVARVIALPESGLSPALVAQEKEEVERQLAAMTDTDPRRPAYKTMLRHIEAKESLVIFRAQLEKVAEGSAQSLGLNDRLRLQQELGRLRTQVALKAAQDANLANAASASRKSEMLEKRKVIRAIKAGSEGYSR